MTQTLYLGIDGGGTRCRARLAGEDGRVLGEGLSGSSNLTLGIETAAPAIRDATTMALAAAGLDAGALPRVHAGFGLAGANVPSLAEAIAAVPFGFASLRVASDAVAACLGAHGGRDGAILILGTGSQGLAIVDDVETAIGGWGFNISDDASGAILGRAAVRAAIRALDGLERQTPLTDAILAQFSRDPAAAVLWARNATPRDYGEFAPAVFRAAHAGDPVGRTLVEAAAADAALLLDRLLALGARRITLTGGLAEPYGPWLPARFAPVLAPAQGDALDGALALARRAARAAVPA